MKPPCGELLEIMAKTAVRDECLIAPFMKVDTLQRLLSHLPGDLPVRVITRWRPEEIAAGVSDIEVFDVLKARPSADLRLCHELHAKVYRFDDRVAAGSANLTGAGLGWRANANLEYLSEVPREGPATALEREAIERSHIATAELYTAMLDICKLLSAAQVAKPRPEVPDPAPVRFAEWLPRTRYPELLERAYRGEWSKLTEATQEAAAYDLAALQVPEGLTSEQFRAYLGAMLMGHPVVQEIDSFLTKPRRFGEVLREAAFHTAGSRTDSRQALQALLRHLAVFCEKAFSFTQPGYTELIARRIPRRVRGCT